MKRLALSLAFAVVAAASLQLFNPIKAFANAVPGGGNCQDTTQACNPGATLNCCNGQSCMDGTKNPTNGPGHCAPV
jgi:hypothetical protein